MKILRSIILLVVLIGCSSDSNTDEETVALLAPTLVSPDNASTCVSSNLVIQWKGGQNSADQGNYTLQIATDKGFLNLVTEKQLSGSEISINLEKGTHYYWRVSFSDGSSNSAFSSPWEFYTESEAITNHLPSTPELQNPNNNETVTGGTTTLSWECTDADGDDLLYDVYFGPDSPPELFQENLDQATLDVTIESGKLYFWKVVVKDTKGGKTYGPTWYFKS